MLLRPERMLNVPSSRNSINARLLADKCNKCLRSIAEMAGTLPRHPWATLAPALGHAHRVGRAGSEVHYTNDTKHDTIVSCQPVNPPHVDASCSLPWSSLPSTASQPPTS